MSVRRVSARFAHGRSEVGVAPSLGEQMVCDPCNTNHAFRSRS